MLTACSPSIVHIKVEVVCACSYEQNEPMVKYLRYPLIKYRDRGFKLQLAIK